jgi:hypothetical protein
MSLVLHPVNQYYLTDNKTFIHCDEVQFRHYCEKHFEVQGCYYCEFDYSEPCKCEE